MFTSSKRVSISTIFVLFALMFLSSTFVHAQGNVNIYRLYNPSSGEHLYTTDVSEVRSLVQNAGWSGEGTGWVAPSSGDPVYRLYNPVLSDHLYTTDTNEIGVLTSQQGWVSDFSGAPIFYSGGGVEIYRLYKDSNGRHHLTTDGNEYGVLPGQGWRQEGVALHAVAQGSPLAGPNDISNTDSNYSIQTDVTLSGSGAGYHAKILAQTPTSAVSFGLQFDTGGAGNYRNQTGFIVENVLSNAPGQQQYLRPGLGASNQTYRLMMTVQNDGTCTFYVNGNQFGPSVQNPNLVGQRVDMSVEGSGKQNGDSVTATFSNIQIKNNGSFNPSKAWRPMVRDTNANVHSDASTFSSNKTVTISGTVSGLAAGQDWDNAYDKVSGVTTFYE